MNTADDIARKDWEQRIYAESDKELRAEAQRGSCNPASAGSPSPITVTLDELHRIAAALSQHGEANLAAMVIGWIDEANISREPRGSRSGAA